MNVNLRYKPDWLFELNPIGLVPVLQWDDKFIYESATCNYFLDEVFPQNKLNPEDPYLRARDRQIWESIGKASLYHHGNIFVQKLPQICILHIVKTGEIWGWY